MAIGDQDDVYRRLRGYLPPWFGDEADTPIINGLLNGLAYAGAYVYGLLSYARLQTRIKTATDGWLDMIAADFFGDTLLRAANQSDDSFRARIILNLFRERATRLGLIRVLEDLTGRTPIVIEPTRPADTGAYGVPTSGYGYAGAYGSLSMPFQAFVIAFRPAGTGIPNVAGYGISTGAYNTASQAEYASLSMIQGGVTDADIYAAIDSVKPVATIVWTSIVQSLPSPPAVIPGIDGPSLVLDFAGASDDPSGVNLVMEFTGQTYQSIGQFYGVVG
ncbi:hypothetical protein [Cupriavidus taiwanensis]|uniref:hypothetical protein n=1 Tax=Cupriavidus taiwanensis TaxID=164546 RepID=UPI000E100515|nr:hypothetical protein [Cupriavidus taiwanensis]SOY56868.1 conserved hypothetical protein [Cupriavidus taiwanensis]SOY90813.1 conserved hypothetical protein [Cupriavidus taiwanensis]SOZ63599.1 conserved hypothetical protein [Cupriavidus taiwanensis]SOZ82621.1 conserved hypothetical protein [Cupriavidus taiwanensis]SOZ84458.1 conserved hypothetical protein [Cupriavidus taiwanensis]